MFSLPAGQKADSKSGITIGVEAQAGSIPRAFVIVFRIALARRPANGRFQSV